MACSSVMMETSRTQMAAISLDELSQVGFVVMADLGNLMFVGIGVETEEDCQLKNVMITI